MQITDTLELAPNLTAFLPDTIRDMAEIIGLPTVLRLVEAYGGITFPVSKGRSRLGEIRHGALVDVVGEVAANQLAYHYGGEELYIPQCTAALRVLRHRRIRSEFGRLTTNGYSGREAVMGYDRDKAEFPPYQL
ncbi:Mor transcription activator family protein [Chitinimonas naiadis]